MVEMEAFKLATRNEFLTIFDFKLDLQRKLFEDKFK